MELDVYKEWLGIPDGPRPPDHYTLLRLVQFEDNADKVRANYKKLNGHVRKYATGQYSVRSQQLLNEIAKAMLCLTDPERKREYDESLGREFPEEPGATISTEKTLVKQGHLTREQAKEVIQFADARGMTVRDAVVQMKLLTPELATQAYAIELKLPYVDLDDMTPDPEILDQVPKMMCTRNSMLPLFVDENVLLVACIDEITHDCEDELRLRFNMPIRRVMALPSAINKAIAEHYAPGVRDNAGQKPVAKAEPSKSKKKGAAEEATAEPKAVPKKAAPAAASAPRFSELSPGEQAHRKQIGMIVMLWSLIGSVFLDRLLIPMVFPKFTAMLGYLPSATALIAVPIAVLWVTKSYWK